MSNVVVKAIYITVFIIFMSTFPQLYAGEWVGPNLVRNGDFNSDFNYWVASGNWFISTSDGNNRAEVWTTGSDVPSLTQGNISVQNGKRYHFGCILSGDSGDTTHKIDIAGFWNSGWQARWPIVTGGFSAHADYIGIMNTDLTSITLSGKVIQTWYIKRVRTDVVELHQIVNNPQFEISPTPIRMNTDSPNGSVANVPVSLNSLSYADEPISWSINWGDGIVESEPTLNEEHIHTYTMSMGPSETWMVELSGSNQAGNDSRV